jgi:uncharacterized protein (TIGR02300 family)
MTLKAARGTKRICPNCGSKFYDLGRNPIVCPVCHSAYNASDSTARAVGGNDLDADDDAVLDKGRSGVEFVPLHEADPAQADSIPDIEGDDLVDVDEDETSIDPGSEEDPAFLENDDEGEADMSGFVGGGSDGDGEI